MALAWARSWEVSTTADSRPLRASSRLPATLVMAPISTFVWCRLSSAARTATAARLPSPAPSFSCAVTEAFCTKARRSLAWLMLSATWTRALSAYLARSSVEGLLGAGDLGFGLRGAGADGGEGLRGVLFQLAERIEVGLLLLQRGQGGLGAADDLAEPGPLLLLGVGDVVIELLLQLERLGHVALGLLQRLREVPDGGVAVLRLREAELLLAGLDGVVGLDQQRTALAAQLLDAEPGQRIQLGALRPVACAAHPQRPSSGGCGGTGRRPLRRRPRRRRPRARRCRRRRLGRDGALPPPAASPIAAAVSMAAWA